MYDTAAGGRQERRDTLVGGPHARPVSERHRTGACPRAFGAARARCYGRLAPPARSTAWRGTLTEKH
eukprot:840091-Prymnesium_polylepis.1